MARRTPFLSKAIRLTGLPFDDRLWVCGYCKAVCVDYPTMREHREKRCKVRQAIERKRERIQREDLAQERKDTLEAWGLR